MQSIQITPANPHIAAGTTAQLKATAVFSDSSHQDVTSQVSWASSNKQTATISKGVATGLIAGTSTISAAIGQTTAQTTLTVTPAVLVSIEVTPPRPSIAKGTTVQFTATGVFSDKSTQNLTSQVSWVSSNPAVATISTASGSAGLATAAGAGSTNISASLNGVTSSAAPLTVTAATLVSIQVTPPTSSIANGLTEQFTATGTYTDNSTQNLTSLVTWVSSDTSVAAISNTVGSMGLASSVGLGSTSIIANLGAVTSPGVSLTVTPATLVSIQVNPPTPSIANGLTQQFTATGLYTDNTTQDLTAVVTWSSSSSGIASISNSGGTNGLATASAVGTSGITAASGTIVSPAVTLTVTAATLVSIQVNPPAPSIANGLTQQFTATGVYTDNSTQDLTATVTWASANSNVATISNGGGTNGLATSAGLGTSAITAALGSVVSPAVTLTVTAATLVSIQVNPPAPSIANGLTQQFSATGTYTDNSTQDLTATVTWASANTNVATISNGGGTNGLATSAGLGTSAITATLGTTVSPAVTLTVTAATLVSIQVNPPTPSIANGLTQQFSATGTYTDNSTQDLTTAVTWASANGSVASISNVSGNNGLATALSVGTSGITAALGPVVSPAVTLTVTAATLVSIQVNPPTPSVANGLTQQFSATGTYTDNSTQDLTTAVTWASANGSVASISNVSGNNGLATALSVGTSGITAALGPVVSPAATLTVTAATLVSIQVNPPAPSIANGLAQQFTATGTYTDNSTQDLTTAVTWASANGSVASISNVGGNNGLATALLVGTSGITAALGPVVSPAATLTVTAATLVSIQVNPPAPSIANGLAQQFSATGTYTDNSTQDLTTAVTWASANGSVASISNAGGTNGLATALSVGASGITAALGSVVSPAATLTVTAATLVSIQVNPPTPSIANGLTQQFSATGTYTDNSTQDLTTAVTWASANGSVASISNAGGTNGLATALSVGTSGITAALGPVVSPAVTLTVTPATLVSIQVMPASASIAKGLTQQFTATGIYTDNSTQDLTAVATWASTSGGVASISNASGSNGLATGLGVGTSGITATSGTVVSPAVTLTVTPATLVSIQLAPGTASIAKGLTEQFTATGTYTDSSTQNLTTFVTWASSAGSVASISNSAGTNGLASALTIGSTNISASYSGVTSPNAALSVTAAALVSIAVAPASATIPKGSTLQFTATGTYTDSSTQDLTKVVTWASATGTVASISNAAGTNGLATALGAGSTNISAAYSGVTSPNAVVTVVAAVATAGIWTATPAAGTTAFMISDAAGNIYYYTSTSTCMALSDASLTLTGSAVTGAGYTMPDVFGPKTTCAPEVHETVAGTLVPSESMQLTSKPTGGGGSSSTINWTFDPIYFQPSALSLVAGSWTMADGTKVTVSGSGALSAHDTTTGCTITGQLAVSDTTVDLYSVTVKYAGCTGAAATLNGAALSGLGMLNTSVTPNQFTALAASASLKTMSALSWVQ